MTARDDWGKAATARMQSHMMRAATKGRDYAPDQTPALSKAGQVGPKSAHIAKILRQHADLWAADGRAAAAADIDFDADAEWRAHILEADAAIDRYLAAEKAGRAA